MNTSRTAATILLLLAGAAGASRADDPHGLAGRPGETLEVGGKQVTVVRLDVLPYVENDYTKRFVFDTYENPKLQKLRQENGLDRVVAAGRDEFDRQCRLLNWAYEQFDFGDPQDKGGLRNALEILELARKEQKFFCVQRAALLVSAAASVGYVCRPCGHATHSWTEMWSNQHRKWVFFDPTPGAYAEANGVPVSTYEARLMSFLPEEGELVFVDGRTGRKTPRTLKYGNFRAIMNTNLMDSGLRYGEAARFEGDPTNPPARQAAQKLAEQAYFPINQAALSLRPEGDGLKVTIRTLTPNFRTFRVRTDEGPWADSPAEFTWTLREGRNVLQAKSVNKFGLDGVVSTVELLVAGAAAPAEIVVPAVSFVAQGGGAVNVIGRDEETSPSYVHLWSSKDHWLEWTVEDAAAGEYDLAVTYAARFSTERRLAVNGRPVQGMESFTLEPTGGWTAFREVRLPGRVRLDKGRNVLRLTCTGDASLCLNRLCLRGAQGRELVLDGLRYSGEGGGQAQKVVSDGGGFFYLWDAAGHWLEWTVEAAAAGEYDAYLHYASQVEATRELKVNGQVAPGLENFAMKASGGWRFWVEDKLPAKVKLQAGRNVVRLTNTAGKSMNLAAIRLVGPGGREVLIQAPAFSGQGGGQVRTESPSRHGYFNFWNDRGHWLEWPVVVPEAGVYDVTLRYSTKARSPRELTANGEPVVGLGSFTLDPTGDWRAWKDGKLPAGVRLKKGPNTLRLTSLGGGGLNLDEIRLRPAGR